MNHYIARDLLHDRQIHYDHGRWFGRFEAFWFMLFLEVLLRVFDGEYLSWWVVLPPLIMFTIFFLRARGERPKE